MRHLAVVCLTLLACDAGTRADKSGSATPKPPASIAIVAGPPSFGCFAWSAELRAAACLLGTHDKMTSSAIDGSFEFPGAPDLPTVSVHGAIDDAAATKVNGVLAAHRFAPLPTRQPFKSGRLSVAPSLLLGLLQREVSPASDGIPPTIETTIVQYCAHDSLTVLADTSPNATSEAMYRVFGKVALVELVVVSSQGAQTWTHYDAALASPSACNVPPR